MPEKSSALIILAKAAGAALVLATLIGGAWLLFFYAPLATAMKAGGAIREGIGDLLQARPAVTVGHRTVFGQTWSVAELATITQSHAETLDYSTRHWGSEKRMTVQGAFLTKAGYDLTQPWSVNLGEDGKTVRVVLPAAKVLSVELQGVEVREEDGWWNKITPEERQAAQNELLRKARASVAQSGLLSAADEQLKARLEPILRRHGAETIRFERPAAATLAAPPGREWPRPETRRADGGANPGNPR